MGKKTAPREEKFRQDTLQEIVQNLPDNPGVYKMIDTTGTVLYVGKAKNLKHRVKSYFQKGAQLSMRTKKLLEKIDDLQYLVTDSELEAYILETNLIKELRPRYNILMKDDKNFVYIKIQLNEDFPRIRIVRKIEKDGAKYIGPKTGSTKVYELFRILKKLFPFRHCQLDIAVDEAKPERKVSRSAGQVSPAEARPHSLRSCVVTNRVIDYPCLDYFIKRCPGPCIGGCTKEEYRHVIDQVIDFLEGRGEELMKKLRTQMTEAAKERKFELASRIRDKLFTVEEIMEKQKVSDPERRDTDVIHFHIELGRAYVNIFLIRDGKLIRHENFILDAFDMDKTGDVSSSEILEAFMKSYYEKAADIPKEILIPESLEDQRLMETWLTNLKGNSVKILIPQKGEKNKLLELSRKNAETFAKQHRIKFLAQQAEKAAVSDLAEVLELKDKKGKLLELRRIECYDISHLGGENTVGSMVVFENGIARREHYRHFKLRTVQGKPDDFSSMKEILSRRLKYLVAEDLSLAIKPPTKKDFENLQKLAAKQKIMIKGIEKKDFVVAKTGEKILGFGSISQTNDKVSFLSSFWFTDDKEKHPGYRILQKLLDRSKTKRLYLMTKKSAEECYAFFGFVPIHQAPESLLGQPEAKRKDVLFMIYEVKKHKVDPSFLARPQLIVVDGGKPQLSAALQALKQFNLDIPVCSLAKRLEEIYLPGKQAPILLEEGEEALKLLQRLRDEAHRFAIEFQRDLKRKQLTTPQ